MSTLIWVPKCENDDDISYVMENRDHLHRDNVAQNYAAMVVDSFDNVIDNGRTNSSVIVMHQHSHKCPIHWLTSYSNDSETIS